MIREFEDRSLVAHFSILGDQPARLLRHPRPQAAEAQLDGLQIQPRLLVFTASRVTQEHLARALAKHFQLSYSDKPEAQPDQALAVIHGGMPDGALSTAKDRQTVHPQSPT